MAERPTGTPTFMFTDIEGSTRLWEQHPDEMQDALERHDRILRRSIESHGGYVFSTAGDAYAAAFAVARDAVAAAIDAQRSLGAERWSESTPVKVRMGLHTGDAQERDGDYFGPVLNRAARVMSAGHGGQILATAAVVHLAQGCEYSDLGEHRLKDLSDVEQLFQVRAEGLDADFGPLRTVNATPGNLPLQVTSFVGRDDEVRELAERIRAHRLVTLTGFAGVGKTRLAVQAAAELITEFGDGVWLVELAPVGIGASVPDAVASVLGVTPQPGRTMAEAIAAALSGRRALVVLDNCEHVVGAVGELVDTILGRAPTVRVLATSREDLGAAAEHVWPVKPLGVGTGLGSPAAELFVARARSVNPRFALDAGDEAAVAEICSGLDGVPLAIELAAARMASMSPTDVRDRLQDRFRLLSSNRRGADRHHTLRAAVEWSYDLLDSDEQVVLDRCSAFSDGFDASAVIHVSAGRFDEYQVLDLLDSLVRKSLVTVEQRAGRTRYGLLNTIRQFSAERLDAAGQSDDVCDLHASYYVKQLVRFFDIWTGPEQRVAVDWAEGEFANLRSSFRWALDRGDLAGAATIAAHSAMLTRIVQQYEPVDWVEKILDDAVAADLAQLPRLYTAASLCSYIGRPEEGIRYAQRAVALEQDDQYDGFDPGWSAFWEATANLYLGNTDRAIEIFEQLAEGSGLGHVNGLGGLLFTLAVVGRTDEAMVIADDAVAAAREYGRPIWIAFALQGSGRAFSTADPGRALASLRESLDYTRDHRLPFFEALVLRDVASLEALHGDSAEALALLDAALELFHGAGDVNNVNATIGYLVVFFDRVAEPATAATLYGIIETYGGIDLIPELSDVVDDLRQTLGEDRFDEAAAIGRGLGFVDAVHHARWQIQAALAVVA
jgi:predicted ATPase/class 3 adenylate cyclase